MIKPKIKVVFIIPSLSPGGAEKVMSFIAQNLNNHVFSNSLWVITKAKENDFLIKGIDYKHLNKNRVSEAIFTLFNALRTERPDIVISSIGHLNIIMALLSVFFSKTKFVGRVANVPSILKKYAKKKVKFSSQLTKLSYYLLDAIVCQSKDMLDDIEKHHNISPSKLYLINNPVTSINNTRRSTKQKTDGCVKFITVASLKEQKGHERIIYTLSKLHFNFIYTIVGDGEEYDKLFALIAKLNLTENIVHVPYTNEVEKYLIESDFFLQGSFVEGFPNCLLESCSVGLPIIAYNAPGGLNEIIEDNLNGYIAYNDQDYLDKIKMAVNKNWDAEKIISNIESKFGKKKIISQYEDFLIKLSTK